MKLNVNIAKKVYLGKYETKVISLGVTEVEVNADDYKEKFDEWMERLSTMTDERGDLEKERRVEELKVLEEERKSNNTKASAKKVLSELDKK